MIFWEIAKKDFKTVYKSKIKMLSILVVILMPLAYGFLYLWASWDPYNNMKNVPVAVVNEDAGAIYKNKTENYGQEIADKLKEKDVVEWEFVDYGTAISGLNSQKYYAVVRIPQNFSADVVSAGGDNPTQAKIEWQTKDSTSYLFTRYFDAVMKELNKEINKEVAGNFQVEAEEQVGELTSKMDQASNGAGTLASGIETLRSGSQTLNKNLVKASDGTNDLKNGLSELNTKSYDLTSGISKTKDGAMALRSGLSSAKSGADNLDGGISTLYSGSEQLKNGIHQAYEGANQLSYGTTKMADQFNVMDQTLSPLYPTIEQTSGLINTLNQSTSTPIDVPNYLSDIKDKKDQLISGQNQIAGGAKNLTSGLADLDNGANNLNTGLSSAKQGTDTLRDGIYTLYGGSNDLYNGLSQVYDGSQKFSQGVGQAYTGSETLSSGVKQLADGSGDLTDGLSKAENGANTLNKKLVDGTNELKEKLNKDKVDKLITVINEPVVMKNVSADSSDTYGSALAPYFISLALWMGALMLALLMPTRDQQLITNNVSKFNIVLGKIIFPAMIGLVQSGLLSFAVLAGLGLRVKYLLPFMLFCTLTSLCFVAIMQFLALSLGKIGELAGILLMLLQLTSSSGTFPVQSAPRIFRIFNPLAPMNYSIKGMRLLILGGTSGMILRQALVLAAIALLFVGLKALWTKKTIFPTDIYPLIEL